MTRSFAVACAAVSAAFALPASASAEVLKQDANGFVIHESRTVEASPREAWMALIAPSKWWNKSHTWSGDPANLMITPQAGGCFCERIPEVETRATVGLAGSVQHMVVVYAAPDVALRMRGSLGPLQSEAVTGVLTISFDKVDKGTAITFEYVVGGYMRYDTATIAKAVDGVMTEQLDGLATLLGPVAASAEKAKTPAVPNAGSSDQSGPEAKAPTQSVEDAFGDLSDD